MRLYLPLFLCFALPFAMRAQYAEVRLDYEKNYLDQNQTLPAEQDILFTGNIPLNVEMVRVSIYDEDGKAERPALFAASWKEPLDRDQQTYTIPFYYKLRASERYDITVEYMDRLSERDRARILQRIEDRISIYLETLVEEQNGKLSLQRGKNRARRELMEIVEREMQAFYPGIPPVYDEFSELLELQLKKMRRLNPVAYQERKQLMRTLLSAELDQLLPKELYSISDRNLLNNVPTESRQGVLSINAGFGGVHFSGGPEDDFDYDSSPYVGLSFPLGNSAFTSKFFSNLSLGFGIMLRDLERSDGREYSGPLINKPFYLGLDYKLFQFIHLSAGATALEQIPNEVSTAETILIRPFVGISARINLKLGLDR